jgi:FkbM family methyltransferase
VFGKQLARTARALYLWRAPAPADVTIGELRMRCWLSDNTCERKFVFTPWRFDVRELAALAEVLPRDGVFVDIGANVGIYTLHAATRMDARGHIVAFEPMPQAYQRLRFNIEATRARRVSWPRIELVPEAIADCAGTCELGIDAGNLGGNSITGRGRFAAPGSATAVSVGCRPLLDALDRAAVRRLDALKIDIEGAEDRALVPFLASAPATLLPKRIVLENSDASWRLDLRAALAERGYVELFRTRLNTVSELRAAR